MIVLDASAWVNVLTAELAVPGLASSDLYVPPHFDVEVIGSIRAMRQRDWITDEQAERAVSRHLRSIFWRTHDPADIRQAWAWRDALSYRDAWYAATARRLAAEWVTSDKKAVTTAQRLGAPARLV